MKMMLYRWLEHSDSRVVSDSLEDSVELFGAEGLLYLLIKQRSHPAVDFVDVEFVV